LLFQIDLSTDLTKKIKTKTKINHQIIKKKENANERIDKK